MIEVTAGKVLQRYYELREKRGTPAPAFFRKRAWAHADAFLAFCAKAEIDDPLRFLEYRFEVADHEGYVPRLYKLRSYRLAELYRSEWKQGERAADDAYARLKEVAGSRAQQAVKSLRVLTHGMERAKQPYAAAGNFALCRAQIGITGGYHPSSRYCPTCPEAVRCAAALYREHGFDVVSLRAGRLHALPQDIAAAAVR